MRGEIKSILVFQEIGYDYQNLWQQIEAKGVLSRQTIVSEVKEYEQALILQVFDLIVSFHNPPRIEAQKALELKNFTAVRLNFIIGIFCLQDVDLQAKFAFGAN